MGAWRSKIILLLIVYFAGFATAVYCFAPVPENAEYQNTKENVFGSILKSDDFAKSFNVKMRQCLQVAKDSANELGDFIKQKYEETKPNG